MEVWLPLVFADGTNVTKEILEYWGFTEVKNEYDTRWTAFLPEGWKISKLTVQWAFIYDQNGYQRLSRYKNSTSSMLYTHEVPLALNPEGNTNENFYLSNN